MRGFDRQAEQNNWVSKRCAGWKRRFSWRFDPSGRRELAPVDTVPGEFRPRGLGASVRLDQFRPGSLDRRPERRPGCSYGGRARRARNSTAPRRTRPPVPQAGATHDLRGGPAAAPPPQSMAAAIRPTTPRRPTRRPVPARRHPGAPSAWCAGRRAGATRRSSPRPGPRTASACDSGAQNRPTANYPHPKPWSLVAPRVWSLVARLRVIPWSLVAHSNNRLK